MEDFKSRDKLRAFAEAQFQREKDRQAMRDQVVRIVKMMVPDWVLKMSKAIPPIPVGDTVGTCPESLYLGYTNGHGVWRTFLGNEPTVDPTLEWSQTVDVSSASFIVKRGPIMWSHVELNTADTTDYSVSYNTVDDGDARWLYVEITLDKDATTQDVILGDNGYFPVDDPINGIVRFRLSQWQFSIEAGDVVPTKLTTAWLGGGIHFPALFAPP